MMTLIAVLAAAAQVGTASAAKDAIRISGVEQQRSIPCDGRDVIVEGVDHVLTFTGACASLTLAGTDSKIVIGLTPGAKIRIEGTGNAVRWRSEREPLVKISGVDNSVARQP
jgi:hypothetical protein